MTETNTQTFSVLNDALVKYLVANEKTRPLFLRIFSHLSSFAYEELESAHFSLGELPKENKKQKKQLVDVLFKTKDGKYLIVEFNQTCNSKQFEKSTSYVFHFYNRLRRTKRRHPIIELINIDAIDTYKTGDGCVRFGIRGCDNNNLKEMKDELYKSIHFVVDKNITLRYNENEDLIRFAKAIQAENRNSLKKVCEEGGDEWMMVYNETEKFMEDEQHLLEYDLAEAYENDIYDAKEEGIEIGTENGRKEGRKEERESIVKNMHKNGFSLEDVLKVIPLPKEEVTRIYYSL